MILQPEPHPQLGGRAQSAGVKARVLRDGHGAGQVIIAGHHQHMIHIPALQQLHRVGGWGFLFDEGFSGYGLGHDAVMAALREQDGLGKKTALTQLLSERLGEKIIDSISLLYSDNNESICSYASLVFEAYAVGDKVAKEILERRAENLISSLKKAKELYGGGRHVVLGGGLTSQRQILEKFLPRGHFEFHFPTLPPIYGAARYCAIKCGEISENFGKNFEITYKK